MDNWDLPAGEKSYKESIELECLNKECDYYKITWEVPGVYETGSFCALDSDKYFCEGCGKDGVEPVRLSAPRSHS